MQTIPAKTIVSSYQDNGWFGSSFTMNIYKGCCHGCIYCDSRSDCYHVENFDEVKVKENPLTIIENDLKSKRKTGIIITGSMSDPYNPLEKQYELTRGALELIHQYSFGLIINTKSDLVARDIDLLLKIQKHSPVAVNITITTADDTLCRKLEQNVSPTSERLAAIKALSDAGIPCGVLLMPILPFINDTEDNIRNIIQQSKLAGARWIYNGYDGFMGVTLRQNQREHYLNHIEWLFPTIKRKYIELYGNTYYCNSPNANILWDLFQQECKKSDLLYKMEDIVELMNEKYIYNQLSLF